MLGNYLKRGNLVTPQAVDPSTTQSPDSEWRLRLQAALGDDSALMAVLNEAPSIEIKVAAVQALTGEDALRHAEREFRSHDRRVHTVAKQCYERSLVQRKSKLRAEALIVEATAIAAETMIPANRLVELDQAWRALDTTLLDANQVTKFDAVQARLVKQVRDSGERHRAINKWVIQARVALTQMNESFAQVIDLSRKPGELLATLRAANAMASGGLEEISALVPLTSPDSNYTAMLSNELSNAVSESKLIEARLKILEDLEGLLEHPKTTGKAGKQSDDTPASHWHSLPPIADPAIANALNMRFGSRLNDIDNLRQQRSTASRQRSQEKNQIAHQSRLESYNQLVSNTEAALAAGQVMDAFKLVSELQSVLDRGDAGTALHTKIAALHGEILRLKEWQRWSGGQVRQELVEEAETLARSVTATAGTKQSKTPVAQLEKYIVQLRAKWKELDRLGGATGKPLWQRFDTAIRSAEQPVAAHKARLAEARETNLATRESLLAQLDAVMVTGDSSGQSIDWKAVALALSRFQTDWRKLGPLEHTIPHRRLATLTKRLRDSVKRVEEPLQAILQTARVEREALVARAKALSTNPHERELGSKIRELQRLWQQHSKSMPLPNPVERALWQEFKTANDALMKQRDLAVKDRNAQFDANQEVREALIARLHALGPDTPSAEIKRVVAEVSTAWIKSADVGRDKSARLEARYRDAQETARQHLAGSARRKWTSTCDGLAAKLALCKTLENDGPLTESAMAEANAQWTALSAPASPWDQIVQSRFEKSVASLNEDSQLIAKAQKVTAESFDDLLLKLELTFGIASPVSAEDARRALKLLAMKNALEGLKSVAPAPPNLLKLCTDAFGWRHITADQWLRLEAVIVALRQSNPDRLRS